MIRSTRPHVLVLLLALVLTFIAREGFAADPMPPAAPGWIDVPAQLVGTQNLRDVVESLLQARIQVVLVKDKLFVNGPDSDRQFASRIIQASLQGGAPLVRMDAIEPSDSIGLLWSIPRLTTADVQALANVGLPGVTVLPLPSITPPDLHSIPQSIRETGIVPNPTSAPEEAAAAGAEARRTNAQARSEAPPVGAMSLARSQGLQIKAVLTRDNIASEVERPGLQGDAVKHAREANVSAFRTLHDTLQSHREASGPPNMLLAGSIADVTNAVNILAAYKPTLPQVVVETRIIQLTSDAIKDLGVEFEQDASGHFTSSKFTESAPTSISRFGRFTRAGFVFNAQFSALLTRGSAKILAQPSATIQSGSTAAFFVGDEVSFASTTVSGGSVSVGSSGVSTAKAGVQLYVSPTVADGGVTLAVSTQNSSLVPPFAASTPIILQRQFTAAETTVSLPDLGILEIGGLTSRQRIRTVTSVPGLGQIPILGELFTHRANRTVETENIVLIGVRIIPDSETALSTRENTSLLADLQELKISPEPISKADEQRVIDGGLLFDSALAVDREATIEVKGPAVDQFQVVGEGFENGKPESTDGMFKLIQRRRTRSTSFEITISADYVGPVTVEALCQGRHLSRRILIK